MPLIRWRYVAGCILLIGLASTSHTTRAGSIFDEDWVPPTPRKPAPPLIETPTTKPASPEAVKPAVPVPPGLPADVPRPAVVSLPKARRAIPTPADQAKSRAVFKEVFAKELGDRSASARRALASKLLALSAESAAVPADQFVLLAGAIDSAKEASDLPLCVKAVDLLTSGYEVDGPRLKSETIQKMNLRGTTTAATNDNCREALTWVEQLISTEDYPGAARLLASIRPLTTEPALAVAVQNHAKELETLRAAGERVAPFVARLKATPADPAANLAVGQFYCFVKGDWGQGLPLLLRSGVASFKTAATLDLATPSDSSKQIEVGDAWWAAADREPGANPLAIRRRAAHWYDLAKKSGAVTGLNRVKLDQRLGSVRPPTAGSTAGIDSPAAPARRVLWFRNNPDEGPPFQALAGNALKTVSKPEIPGLLANPNAYANFNVVVWGINRWRETAAADITEVAQRSLKQFVENGGDLVLFEQFAMTNMDIIDNLFGIKTGGGGAAAKVVPPDLQARVRDAGITDDQLKAARFYNSYSDLPKDATILLQDEKDRNTAAIVPFGKGRLILIGTNTDASQKRLVEEVFDYVYHFRSLKR